jgi:hypothetical protein
MVLIMIQNMDARIQTCLRERSGVGSTPLPGNLN